MRLNTNEIEIIIILIWPTIQDKLMLKQKKPVKKKEVNDLYKLTNSLKDQVGLIWLTMIGYIVYLEFFKGAI